jgi:hypothetical protein
MKREFLTIEGILKNYPNLTRDQVAQWICSGELPFYERPLPEPEVIDRVVHLDQMHELITHIAEYSSPEDNTEDMAAAYGFSIIRDELDYLLFPTKELEKLTAKESSQQETNKPRWDPNTNTLTFLGESKKIVGPTQLLALPLLFAAKGDWVHQSVLLDPNCIDKRNNLSKQTLWFYRIAGRINKKFRRKLILPDGKGNYHIPALKDSSE